ncbi:hypothetical protein Tco_0669304 [Tanacetum coccineum]
MNLITTLSDRIGVLEADLMKTKKTYNTEVVEDDSSKQGRKFSDEGVQDDEGVQEKASTETKIFVQEVTPTEVIQDQEGSEKASDEVSTAGAKKGMGGSEKFPIVSNAEVSLSSAWRSVTVQRRRHEEQNDNEEQRAQIARDAEIARQWDEEERKRVMDEAKTAKKIDWNDPSVIRYHSQKMKPKTIAQARRNMIKYLKN